MNKQLPVVYILSYDHVGIILWGKQKLQKILRQEVRRLKKYPHFKVGWDHEAYVYDYLAAKAPEFLLELKKALSEFPGRLGVGTCTYGQPLSQFINEESNIRQLGMALSTVRKRLNYKVQFYIMSEHAMHSQMPQLLKGFGFKGAILRTHFMMYGFNPAIDEPVVNWQGIDGSCIPAVPTYNGQWIACEKSHELPMGAVTLDNKILTDYPKYQDSLDAFREKFGAKIQPLVASRADDPRQCEEIIQVHTESTGYQWELADSVFELLPPPRTVFSPGPNDFKARMPWGFCGNTIWNKSRYAEIRVLTAERLAALVPGAEYDEFLEKAWKNLLAGQHHDIQIVGLEKKAEQFLKVSLVCSQKIIDSIMEKIISTVAVETERYKDFQRKISGTFIFNPLSWERRDWINLKGGQGFIATVPGLDLGFSAEKSQARVLPTKPLGYRIQTDYFSIQFHKNGGIKELRMNRQREPVLKSGRKIHGRLRGMIDGKNQVSRGKLTFTEEGNRITVTEKGFIGTLPYVIKWFIYKILPRFDLVCEINVEQEKIGRLSNDCYDPLSAFEHEHKLRLQFYPDFKGEVTGIRDMPFMIAETYDKYIEGNYWTALSDNRIGLAVFNKGLMSSVREKGNALSIPMAFSMNYIWDCWPGVKKHFMHGRYRYELAIMPFSDNWRDADLHRRALEYNFPCLVVSSKAWGLPDLNMFNKLRITAENAVLTALYKKNGEIFARFFAYQSKAAYAVLYWDNKPIYLKEVNLKGEYVCDIGYKLIFTLNQIKTVQLMR
ncbi:MAG: hypothetical protein PHV82_03045 [Victivallaceae bacterium]|nr:hypothetical protein [Victivallaceae bacterium]